jgi:hypothetical protein
MCDIWKGNRAGASLSMGLVERLVGERPCFFHAPIGNIHSGSLEAILNSENAVAFRRNLDMRRDPICSRCVCTFNL